MDKVSWSFLRKSILFQMKQEAVSNFAPKNSMILK